MSYKFSWGGFGDGWLNEIKWELLQKTAKSVEIKTGLGIGNDMQKHSPETVYKKRWVISSNWIL